MSAIVAGFLGSSSGIPASTFPTKSAPTSAAFVYIPPPTLANKAIDSAPRENPAKVSRTIVISSTEVHDPLMKKLKNIMKNAVNPSTAKPATPNPITVPPANEIFNASGRLVFAAWVVLTFVFVAIFIPIFPASAEKKAPKINATTINICEVGTTNEIPARTKLTTTTKIDNNLYSAFKNANAPSYIWSEISFILPSPASCFITHDLLTKT